MQMFKCRHAFRAIVVAISALAIVACGGSEERKAKYLEKGRKYIAEENFDKAKVEISNALQIDPKLAEGYTLMGNVLMAKQEYQQAFSFFLKAIELDPAQMEARGKLGRFYLLMRKVPEATEQYEAILAKNPADAEGLLLKASALGQQNDDAGALKLGEAVLAAHPENADAVALVAGLHHKMKQPEKMLVVLIQGIEKNPKNTGLRSALALQYAQKKDSANTIKVLNENIAIEPDKISHRIALASYYTELKDLDNAEKTLRDAVAADDENPQPYLLLSDFLAERRGLPQAEAELKAAIRALPDKHELRFALVKLYGVMKDRQNAKATLVGIIKEDGKNPAGLKARGQLAALELSDKNKQEAVKLIEEVLEENPRDNQALMLQAVLAISEKEPLKAITALREVLKDAPDSYDALSMLADAHTLNREPSLAKEALQKAIEALPKDPRPRLRYAQYLAQYSGVKYALKEVDANLATFPNQYESLLAKVELLRITKDAAGLETVYRQLRTSHPDKPIGHIGLGQVYGSQKKYDAALAEFETAYAMQPDSAEAVSGIASSYMALKQPDKALKRLGEVPATSEAYAVARHLMSAVYVFQKKLPEAEKVLHEAIAAKPKWTQPYLDLSRLRFSQNDPASALAQLEAGLKVLPDDLQLNLSLAELHDQTGAYDKAIAVYEKMLANNPDNAFATNNLAAMLVDRKGDPASVKRAVALSGKLEKTTQPAFTDTAGWAYLKAGDTQKALDILKSTVKKAPEVPIFQYHLGVAYQKAGDKNAAKTHLGKALELDPKFSDADAARTALAAIK